MQQLEVLQHSQMTQKQEPALLALLTDQSNTFNYSQLKKEAARLIGMRKQFRKDDSIGQLEEPPEALAYIRKIGDEALEEQEMKAVYNGAPLIQRVPGCRWKRVPLRMDTAVVLDKKSQEAATTSNEPTLNMNKMKDLYGKTLILCQAPNVQQFADHWRVIWEQQVGVVLWVGAFREANITKIDPYIKLKEGGRVSCGQFRLHTMFVAQFKEEFDVYRVRVRNQDETNCADRELIFLHIHMWRDQRVPDEPAKLADLVSQVQGLQLKQEKCNLPVMMLHCSLGLIRSASMLAVYISRQMWLAHRRVNILGILRYIRRHRWLTSAFGDAFAQVRIIFGVVQIIAMRSEMAGISNLNVAAQEQMVFDRDARLNEAAGQDSHESTEKLA